MHMRYWEQFPATPFSPHRGKGLSSRACRGLPVLLARLAELLHRLVLHNYFFYLHSIFISMSLSVPAACFFIIQIKWNWILSMCCERKGSVKKLCLLGLYLLRPAGKTASILEMSAVCTTEQCQAVSGASKEESCKQIQGRLLCFWACGLANKGRILLL